jgi:hypothetical protein
MPAATRQPALDLHLVPLPDANGQIEKDSSRYARIIKSDICPNQIRSKFDGE